ncbi:hypothetical protein LTR22_023152 [Elasticomyces elasticus]|nr:hypothetical protein LTR22_023152 [Elasticomyces elasticus]
MPAFTAHPMPPPPPPALTDLSADDGFEDLNFAIEPTLPSTFHANAAFLLSMGEPPHPDLDKAIADGDDTRVFAELARIRNRYSQPSVTFNTANSTPLTVALIEVSAGSKWWRKISHLCKAPSMLNGIEAAMIVTANHTSETMSFIMMSSEK